MINAEIFFSVMLAILAAKYIFLSIQALTIGSVQSRLGQLDRTLSQSRRDTEEKMRSLGGRLAGKLESIELALSSLNEIRNNTRDIKLACKHPR